MTRDMMNELEKQMHDELHGACKYIKCALRYRGSDQVMADLYYTMSAQEMNHYQNLYAVMHSKVSQLPEGNEMKIVHDYLAAKQVDKVAKIKAMMVSYKE